MSICFQVYSPVFGQTVLTGIHTICNITLCRAFIGRYIRLLSFDG